MTRRKRRPSKRKRGKRSRLYFSLTLLVFLLLVAIVGVGAYFYELGKMRGYQEAQVRHSSSFSSIKKVKRKEKIALKNYYESLSEIEDFQQNGASSLSSRRSVAAASSTSAKRIVKKRDRKKPRLAIIIDDVAYGYQVRALKNLHLKLNLSFFPPSAKHPNTPRYAKTMRHYMIHLPLEALHFPYEEANTLYVKSDSKRIEQVIAGIRRAFPRARFVNNHTGSRFTADKEAMMRLIGVLDRYGFGFIDSRTTASTKVPQVQKIYGHPYIARDIFLDNEQNERYIRNQLKKAIEKAKRKGYAIAIGHPHPTTIKALKDAKGLLKQVRLVYVDELFKDRK